MNLKVASNHDIPSSSDFDILFDTFAFCLLYTSMYVRYSVI